MTEEINPGAFAEKARRLMTERHYEAANQAFFSAAELYGRGENKPLALQCYRDALIAKLRQSDVGKDWYVPSKEEPALAILAPGFPDESRRIYRRLSSEAQTNGYWEAADRFHVQACEMTRKAHWKHRALLRCLVYTTWWLLCGYGVRLRNWSLSVIFVCALSTLWLYSHQSALFQDAPALQGTSELAQAFLRSLSLIIGEPKYIVAPASITGAGLYILGRVVSLVILAGAANLAVHRMLGRR